MELNRVCHNYIDIFELLDNTKETDCFIDVHCNSFVNQNNIRSVMRWYTTDDDEAWWCSCALINQDRTNSSEMKYYVITANHCGKNAELSTAQFYFNYQRPDCGSGSSTTYYSTIGATKKAKRWVNDMFLMELDEKPSEDYNVHFAGWDRSSYNNLFIWVTGIHHPYHWVKKVSEGHLAENSNPSHWRIRWDDAPVANGSSGSPLFEDWDDRIIGWNSYGLADCNLVLTSKYGKLRKAWTGSSSGARLKDWLDPNNNDRTGIDGRDPCFTNVILDNRVLRSAQTDYQPQNNVIIQAGNELSTSNSVEILNNADYTFRAGNRIVLNPGFNVEHGASFNTEIINCQQFKYSQYKTFRASRNMGKTKKSDVVKAKDISQKEMQVVILPNPNNGTFSIRTNDTDEEYSIIVYDSFGKVVYQKEKIFSEFYEINLLNVSSGIYLLRFYSGDKLINKKLIVR